MTQPLAIDLFCGLGGWTDGLIAEGYRVIGFDNVRHVYGADRYPGQLVIQDVLTIHGRQLKGAALIVASPPCQEYSYRAMPWKRAKALPPPDNALFDACFRIQREASEAAGQFIPLIVENVRGAQPWIGRAAWHYGSYYLWGDVPALMPAATRAGDAVKTQFQKNQRDGHAHTPRLTNPIEHGSKQPGHWFKDSGTASGSARFGSKSKQRKEWSARIAKIPLPLSQHIARAWKP